MIIQVENLSKKYGSQDVVKQVSFAIAPGEIVGFLGLNGAGKSTTLKMLAGCIPPDQGHICIQGIDLLRHPLEAKSHLGFLPEENPLYGEMYGIEYLNYTADLYLLKNKRARIEETIRQTGLQKEIHKKIEQLSKGYKQRLGIAQAIIHQPDLLLLDEPTSGLDPNQIEEIHQLLVELSKDKAILFSSHTLSEVATICTRILFIHQGKLVADLPRNEIIDLNTLFKQLTHHEDYT
ncbi:MAG: ABC transporter ATP-binding protein [Dysgonamonadaceae bacterium]|jgi:ABC-2 type transport system ATP-binding protein|nr:ABC transporter ATP-binding protein [Dysgonamonadaceae bacterium]